MKKTGRTQQITTRNEMTWSSMRQRPGKLGNSKKQHKAIRHGAKQEWTIATIWSQTKTKTKTKINATVNTKRKWFARKWIRIAQEPNNIERKFRIKLKDNQSLTDARIGLRGSSCYYKKNMQGWISMKRDFIIWHSKESGSMTWSAKTLQRPPWHCLLACATKTNLAVLCEAWGHPCLHETPVACKAYPCHPCHLQEMQRRTTVVNKQGLFALTWVKFFWKSDHLRWKTDVRSGIRLWILLLLQLLLPTLAIIFIITIAIMLAITIAIITIIMFTISSHSHVHYHLHYHHHYHHQHHHHHCCC